MFSHLSNLRYQKLTPTIELLSVNEEFSAKDQSWATDPSKDPWLRRNSQSWRFTVFNGAVLTFIVLVFNITVAVVASKNYSKPNDGGSARTIVTNDCEKVRHMNTWAHLVINLMSTIMLSASNFAMQCLSAPTRAEVDRAHAKKHWVDIGVLSLRNIRFIERKRVILLTLLGISSLPLHMFYNSAIHPSLAIHDYNIFSATNEDLMSNSSIEALGISNAPQSTCYDSFGSAMRARQSFNLGRLQRLSNADCISAYGTGFQSTYGDLILVTNVTIPPLCYQYSSLDPEVANLDNSDQPIIDPFSWVCNQSNGIWLNQSTCPSILSATRDNSTNWHPFNMTVSYCLAAVEKDRCELKISVPLLLFVITFSLVKVAVLGSFLLFFNDTPLLTIGDAVASFLQEEDDTTKSLCLMGKQDIGWWHIVGKDRVPRPYESVRQTWGVAASGSRWMFCVLLYFLTILLCIIFFFKGTMRPGFSMAQILSLGLGATDQRTLLDSTLSLPTSGSSALILNALVANVPQVALSIIYYSYNSLFTCFMLGREWDQLGRKSKGLRVSQCPRGSQRSTYFLQLPYRFAFPLMAFSGVLHWFCAQSLFLVTLQDASKALVTVGYSPVAILALTIMALSMLFTALSVGNRKVRGIIPFAGTCSASISAMCHPHPADFEEKPECLPVKWGVTDSVHRNADDGAIRHCSISHRHVEMPEVGRLYAG